MGTQTFSTPGTTTFVVPSYSTLQVTVNGPGGGSGGINAHSNGGTGSAGSPASQFVSSTPVVGNGGGGGGGANASASNHGTPGADGTASGGDTNTTGGGATGGVSTIFLGGTVSGAGGNGGQAVKTWLSGDAGAPAAAAVITVTVGSGGAGGTATGSLVGSAGNNGSITVTWVSGATTQKTISTKHGHKAFLTTAIAYFRPLKWLYNVGPGPSLSIGSASSAPVTSVNRNGTITITSYFYARETAADPGGYLLTQTVLDPNFSVMGTNASTLLSIVAGTTYTVAWTYAIPAAEPLGAHVVSVSATRVSSSVVICSDPASMTFQVPQ